MFDKQYKQLHKNGGDFFMGTYLNPGNSGFPGIVRDTYVDKTGLILCINQAIDTPKKLICISRPRRFGKSFVAKIKDKQYPDAIRDYGGDVLLVGINYDTEKKTHECRIERFESECTM